VIELTESKTLWYNYNFFKELFSLTSMDVVDNQHYITKWVEDNIINGSKNGVNHITSYPFNKTRLIEDAIQNGVKETIGTLRRTAKWGVDDIIQNGVKETHDDCSNNIARVEGIVRIGEKLN